MTWKQWGSVVGIGAAMVLLGVLDAAAATRAIPGVKNAASTISDTISYVCFALAAPLIAWTIYEARQHGMMGAVWQIGGTLAVVAIALFADDIITSIRPSTALAFTPGVSWQMALAPSAWWAVLVELGPYGLLTLGVVRVRRARRI